MIPGIMSGSAGGGQSISTPSSSSLDVKNSFENQLGGNAGVNFGAPAKSSMTLTIAAAMVVAVLGLAWMKKRTGAA